MPMAKTMFTYCAYDDGGRHACTSASFKVKSESEIKITTPNKTVLPPNSTIFIETTSKVTLGINAKVKLHGLNGENSYDDNSPLMLQTSRVGNTISHRFPWRQSKEGRYYIRTVLYENGENTDTEDATEVIIAEPRVIKIFSLSNGQEFEEYKPIRIAVDAMDVKGNIVQDQ